MIARSNAHDFRPFCLDLHHRDLAFAGSSALSMTLIR